ncbi:hypothetical protein XW81_01290 [Buchnera aphidicola (Schlechtendalia chinensis)]|uniref:Inner membrane-spanning protein YciB n=1 Tax=Buchnera aphidicola subsp. Schlechtendalia chinensis TaxID=118110 RepID=A0A172WDH9_BUCSC|nr:septation protein A [Buchnera aphidicola]ANF17040.1 hypothetical protein XW81_01290 [Buchnera aphidicola (Schlechtendalia chinensis)]
MKYFLNFLPMFIFFIIYKFYDIFIASTALMISTVISCILIKIIFHKIDKSDYINCVSSLFFGSLTLLFHNGNYIKWKVTIIYLCLSGFLLINHFFSKKLLIQKLLEKKVTLSNSTWSKINVAWTIFFLACASANLYVMFYLSENTWITFKVFGLTLITLLFIFINCIYINYSISKKK